MATLSKKRLDSALGWLYTTLQPLAKALVKTFRTTSTHLSTSEDRYDILIYATMLEHLLSTWLVL